MIENVEIGEPTENPDTIVFPVKDPVPKTNPEPIPQEPRRVKEPKKIPA